jgi:uncharacterized OB-fold protein
MTDSPLPDPELEITRPFFDGAAQGELRIPRCRSCRRFVWYPRERCPACDSDAPEWVGVSGNGTIYSFAVVRRALWKPFADRVPYATGLVSLAEDPAVRIVTTFVDCRPEDLAIDQAVHAVFEPLRFGDGPELVVPFFAPAR